MKKNKSPYSAKEVDRGAKECAQKFTRLADLPTPDGRWMVWIRLFDLDIGIAGYFPDRKKAQKCQWEIGKMFYNLLVIHRTAVITEKGDSWPNRGHKLR
jgi:hypothetical protein